MISIIVCYISPSKLDKLKRNISETIGDVPYEVIALDNRESPKSIAGVYNDGASKAIYPNLLFIHEDAGFVDKNWMSKIGDKLAEPDCGVIGFAGSRLMSDAPGGWNVLPEYSVWNLLENGRMLSMNIEEDAKPFREVVAVDGFAMFVRRNVWQEIGFDETMLRGFHCYDVDFSLSVGSSYRNYVCTDILLYHDSKGNFGEAWARETLRMYNDKWKKLLPRHTADVNMTTKEEKRIEERVVWRFLKMMKKYGMQDSGLVKRFKHYSPTISHLKHLFKAELGMRSLMKL